MPKTLLLADDSVTIQKVVGISFASEDIEIVTVDNGRDAVNKAREVRPDIILADVVMPAMSGYEVCEAVKGDPALAHIPVLLLTGTFEAFDETRAAAAGAAGHVAKPFEAQTLVDRVKQLLAAPPAPPAARPATAAPAPPPVPAAKPAREDAEAFDFFSEPAHPPARTRDAELDVDEPDAAFAFGDDDLADALQEPASAPPLGAARPDATVAILPDPPPAAAPGEDDSLDFSFENENESDPFDAPVPPRDLSQTTLLDPAAGADFDVSSSDLSAEVAALTDAARPAAPRTVQADPAITEPEADEAPPAAPEPVRPFGVGPQPPRAPAAEPRPARAQAPPPPAAVPWPTPPAPPAMAKPVDPVDSLPAAHEADDVAEASFSSDSFESSFDEASFDDESLEDATFAETSLDPESLDGDEADDPIQDVDPLPDTAPPAPEVAERPSGSSLSPMMREEIQATLEKIAWDAFGQVTEKIVRQAIERIEQVAWEVVPKLAETLIQEEIRRLKGDSES